MAGIIRNGQLVRLGKAVRRKYSVSTLSLIEELYPVHQDTKPIPIVKAPILGDKLHTIPSIQVSKSYTISRESAPLLLDHDKSHHIKTQILELVAKQQYDSLAKLLLSWARHDSQGMLKLLGHHQFSEYMKLLMSHKTAKLMQYMSLVPILKLIEPKSKIKQPVGLSSRTDTIRKIYCALIYTDSSIGFYDGERRHDIYATSELTGYKLCPIDYENLMQFEINNRKLDLASKWFKIFKREFSHDYITKMTPKMWELVFQIYSGGNYYIWDLKSTELSSNTFEPKRTRFTSHINSNELLNDFRKSNLKISEMGLSFHETLICSLGYEGKLAQLYNFISKVWGVDKSGKLISGKLNLNDAIYPTMKTVIVLFSSIAYNGHFFEAMKFISEFQKSYEISGNSILDKEFFNKIFNWCDISTKFEEDRALVYFLKRTNVKTKKQQPTLNEISNNVNFDYEGYLEFIKKLKQERNQAFQQLWEIYQQDEIDYNSRIYSIYFNYLKEGIAENIQDKYYDYLSALLKQYQLYHSTNKSFNRRTDLGFQQVNEKHQGIYIYYQAAMKELIEIKGQELYIEQCQPLIDEWSIDKEMKQQLTQWFKNEKIEKFKMLREQKRQEFMNSLNKEEEDEEDSLLNLM